MDAVLVSVALLTLSALTLSAGREGAKGRSGGKATLGVLRSTAMVLERGERIAHRLMVETAAAISKNVR